MINKNYIIITGVLMLVAFAGGRFLVPAKVVTKIVTQTQTVTVHDTNVVTVVKEVDKPGGEVDKTTTTTDLSTSNTDTTSKDTDKTVTDNEKPQWHVGATYGANLNSSPTALYGVRAEKRFLGPIFLGAWGMSGTSATSGGLSVSLEF